MGQEENEIYDSQEKEQEGFGGIPKGYFIDPITCQPLNKSSLKFTRQFPTSAVEPERPEPEPAKEPEPVHVN